jgi:hypothetical protein
MTTQNDSFLPENYEIPSTSQYMKFKTGVNTFRVLDKPIMGMEFWKTKADGKRTPIRKHMGEVIQLSELEINPESGKLDNPAHFWAMPVWNYKDKQIQILEIKQKGILEAIKSYIDNPKWGSPTQYDITVTKSGEALTTKYLVDHDPKEELDKDIAKQYKGMKINLEALFDGQDPFQSSKPEEVSLEAEIEKMGEKAEETMPF